MSEVLDAAAVEKARAWIAAGGRIPAFRTYSPEQLEDLLHGAGIFPDPRPLRHLNALLAGLFWRENWHRGFWPLRVALR